MPPKKCPSGSAKKKRRREKNALIESQIGALDKLLKSNTSILRNPDELALVLMEEQTNDDPEEDNIDMDDNSMSDHLIHRLQNLLMLMQNRLVWIL
jgi:hypothetical protein